MSDNNPGSVTQLTYSVQLGSAGGYFNYEPAANQFYVLQSDTITPAPLQASNLIATTGVNVVNIDGTITILDTSIGYDSPGVLQFQGSAAVIIPVGDDTTRPSAPKIGMLRLNIGSTIPYLEYYNGISWQNVTVVPAAGKTSQIQYNNDGALSGSSRYTISFDEQLATTTLSLGDPQSFTETTAVTSSAIITGAASTTNAQGTVVKIFGGNNSGTGSGGSVVLSGGYAIANGTYAGSVVLMGGESSVGNHGHIICYTVNSDSGTEERLRISGGTGAWGLNGPNYGSAGQVLTSNGYSAPPTWTNITGVAKQHFAFNTDNIVYVCVVPDNAVILSISIVISTAFDDPSTTITVGDAAVPDRLFTSSDVLPGTVGTYTIYPNYIYGAATQVTLTWSGVCSAGSGVVLISYE